eukprot:4271345-Alexandrium_andersonii.AAC.1
MSRGRLENSLNPEPLGDRLPHAGDGRAAGRSPLPGRPHRLATGLCKGPDAPGSPWTHGL